MFRKNLLVNLAVAAALLLLPAVIVRAADSGDSWLDRLLHREKRVSPSAVIPWSHASSRPDLASGDSENGLLIWHDRNTVHVTVQGERNREHTFHGWVEIKDGSIDTLQDDGTERDDEFRQMTNRRILFTLTAGAKPHGFRFNLRGGSLLVVSADRDNRRVEHVFFGESLADAHGNPAIFRLRD